MNPNLTNCPTGPGKLSFDATESDGSPRRFVGMHRPPYEEIARAAAGVYAVVLPSGRTTYTHEQLHAAWVAGECDKPLYDTCPDGGSITCAVVLRIQVQDGRGIDYITDALGECARDLESFEAEQDGTPLGLVPDPDDPGRYAWSIVVESYS